MNVFLVYNLRFKEFIVQPRVQKLLQSFFYKFKLLSFAKGEAVISPLNKKIFFLTKGVVKMTFLSKEGIELTLNIYKPFSIFPMSIVFNGKENKYLFSSLTKAEGYFAPLSAFRRLLKKNPGIVFDLLKRIYQGLDGFFLHLESLLLGDAYLRILTHLIIYAKRFGQVSTDKIIFNWQLTHQQLASQTGLARESVTREIKKLQDKGLIGYDGKKLFIYDISKLEQECDAYAQRRTYSKNTP